MPPIPGMMQWHSLIARHARSLNEALQRASKALEARLSGQSSAVVEPVLVRNSPKQPLHPLARIRQSQSRWFSTARRTLNASSVRHFTSSSKGPSGANLSRSAYATSKIGSYISNSSGRAPFASTLRPNLTGGTLGRTAGGYSLGSGRAGGSRYFSHVPASQAQVVQNVSQAVRAFFISGQKAQFDGVSPHTGEKRFKAVSALQHETGHKMRSLPKATPGSWIEFQINPTITALTPLNTFVSASTKTAHADHLNTDGLLDVLSVDFSRALRDLAVVLNDLRRLSALGDLPITQDGSHLRVHFPGCDAGTVERLCEELNVRRGTVVQDDAFDAFVGTEIALLFPLAPSKDGSLLESDSESDADMFEYRPPAKRPIYGTGPLIQLEDMLSVGSRDYTASNLTTPPSDFEDILAEANPWLSSPSGYETASVSGSDKYSPLEYQGFEGICRFIEELDAVRR